jgi:hypothetical protein
VLRVPLLEDLRAVPFQRASYEASDYDHWLIDRIYALVPAQAFVGKFLMTFKEFPPRQKPASSSLDQVMERTPPPPITTSVVGAGQPSRH